MISRHLGAEEGVRSNCYIAFHMFREAIKIQMGNRLTVNEEMEMSLVSVVTKKWMD